VRHASNHYHKLHPLDVQQMSDDLDKLVESVRVNSTARHARTF
jgi:hypothetical protein